MHKTSNMQVQKADLELALVSADGEQEAVPGGLQVGPLLAHQLGQQLLLQAGPGNREVDKGNLDAHLWQVVGVGQWGGHVQLEAGVVLHVCVPQMDHRPAPLLKHLQPRA